MRISPRTILVMTALGERSKPGVWAEFYQVEGVLALLDLDVTLSGHPGIDLLLLPQGDQYIFNDHIRPGQASQIANWLDKDRFTAISVNPRRNKRGDVTENILTFSWRNPTNYLTAGQCTWLDAYAGSSFDYTDRLQATLAAGRFIQALGQHLARQPQPRPSKRPKVKAKDRRRTKREQELRMQE